MSESNNEPKVHEEILHNNSFLTAMAEWLIQRQDVRVDSKNHVIQQAHLCAADFIAYLMHENDERLNDPKFQADTRAVLKILTKGEAVIASMPCAEHGEHEHKSEYVN